MSSVLTGIIPTVAVRLYRPLALELDARGIDSEALFQELGLPHPAECGWDVRAPLPTLAPLWERVIEATEDPFFALRAAERMDLSVCDVITHFEGTAQTVREAIENKLKFLPVITNAVTWTLEVVGSEAVLALHECPPRAPLAPVAEYLLASRHCFFKMFGPPEWHLREVAFRHAKPGKVAEYERVFGIRPTFGSGGDELVFSSSLLDGPMARREKSMADIFLRYLECQLASAPQNDSWATRVHMVLRGGRDPGIAKVARQLGVTPRTLQRALKNENTTYQNISNDVSRSVAERLLSRRELSIAEVSFALGFTDVATFHKAFVRWTGTTPGRFRANLFDECTEPPAATRLGLQVQA